MRLLPSATGPLDRDSATPERYPDRLLTVPDGDPMRVVPVLHTNDLGDFLLSGDDGPAGDCGLLGLVHAESSGTSDASRSLSTHSGSPARARAVTQDR